MEPSNSGSPVDGRRFRCMVNPCCPLHGLSAGPRGPLDVRPMRRPCSQHTMLDHHGTLPCCMVMSERSGTQSFITAPDQPETQPCMTAYGQRGTQSCMTASGQRGTQSCMTASGQRGTQSCMTMPDQRGTQSCMTIPDQRGMQSCISTPDQRGTQSYVTMPHQSGTQNCVTMPGQPRIQPNIALPGQHGSQFCVRMSAQHETQSVITIPDHPQARSCMARPGEPGVQSYVNIPGQPGIPRSSTIPQICVPRQPTPTVINHEQPDWIRSQRVAYLMDGTPVHFHPGTYIISPTSFVNPNALHHETQRSNVSNSEHFNEVQSETTTVVKVETSCQDMSQQIEGSSGLAPPPVGPRSVSTQIVDLSGAVPIRGFPRPDRAAMCRIKEPVDSTRQSKKHENLPGSNVRSENKTGSGKQCSLCGTKFVINKDFDKHVTRTFHCTFCKKMFCSRKLLLFHIRSHGNGAEYRCEICGRQFQGQSALTVHYRIHTGEKPYQCEFCDRRFSQLGNKNQHMTKRHATKRFPDSKKKPNETVPQDDKLQRSHKRFSAQPTLLEHFGKHTEKKPFSCKICGQIFTREINLKSHDVVHTGEKPYKCGICEKMFAWKSNRNAHQKVCNGNVKELRTKDAQKRPFSCEICGKTFTQERGKRRHSVVHTGKRPHKCSICDEAFAWESTRNKHRKKHGKIAWGSSNED